MYQISTYQMHSLLNVFPQVVSWETKAADNVDDLLEQFLGIRDLELGMYQITTIFYLLVFSSSCQPHSWWTFAKARSSWTTLPCPLMSTWESLSSLVSLSLTSGRPLAAQRAPPSCDHVTQCGTIAVPSPLIQSTTLQWPCLHISAHSLLCPCGDIYPHLCHLTCLHQFHTMLMLLYYNFKNK